MDVKTALLGMLNSLLKPSGYQIINRALLYDWQTNTQIQTRYNKSQLPSDAASYLQSTNPRFLSLCTRYANFNAAVTNPLVWVDNYLRPDDILYFRGDNAYVWQRRGANMSQINYAVTFYYLKTIDTLSLLDTLMEDDLFGNFTFRMNDTIISRDLLDSMIEIYFLEKHLHISSIENVTILDIGAGYGRLAHRMVSALPSIKSYICTDAVALSTFICEYYILFRNLDNRATVAPLDEVETVLKDNPPDIAINIHSFSECRQSAIEWWLTLLARYSVKYLMIVPNALDADGKLVTNDGKEFMTLVERSGYILCAKEPKYGDETAQQFGICPTYHYLFERR